MKTRRVFLALILLASAAGTVMAADKSQTAAIDGALAADRARFEAAVKADVPALNRVLADDLTYCHSSGKCEGKVTYVDSLATGKIRHPKFESMEQKARVYGEVVLINGRASVVVINEGAAEQSFEIVYTDAFVKRDGRYQMIAWQSTRLPAPTPAK